MCCLVVCPGLRPVIAEFIDNRAAAAAAVDDGVDATTRHHHHHHRAPVLRLAFSGSVTALAAVCAYIHTGILTLPSPFDAIVNVKSHPLLDEVDSEDVDTFHAPGFGSDLAVDVGSVNQLQVLLELVKTATELGMVALKAAALDCVLLSLTEANVDETELFCRSRGGLGDMVEVCRLFRLRQSSPSSSPSSSSALSSHAVATSGGHTAHAHTRTRASAEVNLAADGTAVTGGGAASGVIVGSKKPKPGGIYGLLLKGQGEQRGDEDMFLPGDGDAEEKNTPCYSYTTSAARSSHAHTSHDGEDEEDEDDASYVMSTGASGGGDLETTLMQSPDAARGHHYHYHTSLNNGSSSSISVSDGRETASPRRVATTIPPHLRPKAAFGRAG